jgi:hypothetical protein
LKKLILVISFFYLLTYSTTAQVTSLSSGSGIVISTDGLIATNNHVVEDAIEIFVDVFTNGIKKSYKANVIKTDKVNDLAIIKINDSSFNTFSTIPYAFRMQGINVGEKVFAMGYPRPGVQGEEVKVTDGIISSKTGFQNDNKTYQISAPIQPGNSGGPLFDNSGNLIGLTASGIPSGENVGYAIKISYLNNLLDLLPSYTLSPQVNSISRDPLTEKIKKLSNFTVLIRVITPSCDLKEPSSLFAKINSNSNLKEISSLFNSDGDNYRTDGNSAKYYRWYFCDNINNYVDCWFIGEKIILSMKTFSNQSCIGSLTDAAYKSLKTGLSYNDVCAILGGKGDKYRTDYGSEANYYKWYDCDNENLYFEVWFLNNKAQLITKGNVSE